MAFRTQKISQMTPKGSDLEATDLIEVSTIESGSYVTRSITGQELIDAIPAPSVDWGDIGGTLSDQTDLNTALSGKVPTSRTLTINGTTQDLSADRTFTISTGITIGTTLITSGTVGRVLFEGTGNVVQESANLTWDNTNSRLALNGTLGKLMFPSPEISFGSRFNGIHFTDSTYATSYGYLSLSSGFGEFRMFAASSYFPTFYSNGAERMRIFTTGNIGINTTTDAGFRLDVNGTARVSVASGTAFTTSVPSNGGIAASFSTPSGGSVQFTNGYIESNSLQFRISTNGTQPFVFMTQGTERMRLAPTTGNVLINTTTDAGFRLDVNGTARVVGATTLGGGITMNTGGGPAQILVTGYTSILRLTATSGIGSFDFAKYNGYAQIQAINEPIRYSSPSHLFGGTTLISSALINMESTTQGFLPPRMTTTQKNAIASPAAGLQIFDTTLNMMSYYNGTIWISL